MKILIDTCILSELRHSPLDQFMKRVLSPFDDEDLFLSVVTVGEISKGISLLSDSQKKRDLTNWLNALEHQYSDRILPIDREIAYLWGEMTARTQKEAITIPVADGLIAATALAHGLHILTRNGRHFKKTGVYLLDLENA